MLYRWCCGLDCSIRFPVDQFPSENLFDVYYTYHIQMNKVWCTNTNISTLTIWINIYKICSITFFLTSKIYVWDKKGFLCIMVCKREGRDGNLKCPWICVTQKKENKICISNNVWMHLYVMLEITQTVRNNNHRKHYSANVLEFRYLCRCVAFGLNSSKKSCGETWYKEDSI